MIKNIIFDIDGTIWNSTEVVAIGWQKAIDELGYSKARVDAKRLEREFGLPMNIIADHIFTDLKDEVKKAELLELCCRYEHECLLENQRDISYEGIVETIEKLSKQYRIFIVSNCQKGYIELVMDKVGIEKYIEDYLCYGDTLLTKGETMSRLMEKNDLDKSETVYVGDTQGDKDATLYAGATFIYAEYGFGQLQDEKYAAHSPSEIIEVVKAIDEIS